MGLRAWISARGLPAAVPVAEGFLAESAAVRLREQLRWFNRLRFGAALGIGLLSGLALAFDFAIDPSPLLWLTAITLLLNVGYVRWLQTHAKSDVLAMRRHVDLQIGGDLTVLTAVLHFSGGVGNPLVLSFLFHTVIAAFLRSVRGAVVVGALSMLCVLILAIGARTGWLSHRPASFAILDPTTVGDLVFFAWLFTIAVVLGLSVFLVAAIVGQLGRRDVALRDLSRQLARSEKLASIGTLAAGVSHEINNPVGVIQSRAGVLRYRIQDGDAPDLLLAEVEVIAKHAKRIATITDGLLAFSREQPFGLQPVLINRLAQEAVDLVRVPFRDAQLGLDLRLAPGDPAVMGSANHLLQVLVNLLLNARDASPPGSRVTLATEEHESGVAIWVADQGVGIPKDLLEKIFDPFFTTKEVGHGTGLGLALSHGIVDRHGGRIEVETAVGAGARFTVILPRPADQGDDPHRASNA